MGEVLYWAAALAFLGSTRAWDAHEQERKSRQEEVFVPFKLPPFPQPEQALHQSATEDRPSVAVASSASHAPSIP